MNTSAQTYRNNKGFTLIELLVVIGILSILLAITLIAINPAHQFALARNTQRQSDVNSILNAVHQYMADPVNKGNPPALMPTTPTTIGTGTGNYDLCGALTPKYIADLPVDPSTGSPTTNPHCGATGGYNTDYQIFSTGVSGSNRITVSAPHTDESVTISVTR